jgi:hypothetical protein
MATKDTIVNMLNTIRANGTPTYRERIPQATIDNITSVANPLMTYADSLNEFLTTLINRIAFTIVRNRDYHNPLEILKQGSMPLGFDIQEIFTNPAEAQAYNVKSTDLLAQTIPDVKTCYHRLTRRDRYSVTVSNEDIKTAFTSYDNLGNMIDSIVNTLYSGNYVDEFILAKQLFSNALENNKLIPVVTNDINDETSAKAFVRTARQMYRNFSFPSSSWNSWSISGGTGKPCITWCNPEDIRLIITAELESYLDVDVLSVAFNMDKAQLLGQTLVVDDFGTMSDGTQSKLHAVIMDKAYTQIWDNERIIKQFDNGSNLTMNYYYHVWQTYSVSPFANAVGFVTE